jgi:gamma-F420-2:alpha-L-glutamate ligase
MNAWLIYFREGADYNHRYIEFYKEEGRKLGMKIDLLIVEEITFGVDKNKWFLHYQGKELPKPDFAICRAIYPLLNKQLEVMGIPVYNNSTVSEICNDKARTYQYLASTGIHMVNSTFYLNDQAESALKKVTKPSVMKAVNGHGGSQVFYVNPGNENYDDILKGLNYSDVVLQPLTGSKHQDLRVYVIGTEIIAAVLRTAKEGFKSNFSLGGEVSLYSLSEEEIGIVNKIIEQFDFGLVGIDFIIGDHGELIFNEIEDVVGSRMLYQVSDINIVERYLKFLCNKHR